MHQQTLSKKVTVTGIGLHSGKPATITLGPAEENTGITFIRNDLPAGENTFSVSPDGKGATQTCPSPLCTRLKNEYGHTLSTVEHLMATFMGLGVTNATVTMEGPELPILDGSAKPWVEAVDAAERTQQSARALIWPIPRPIALQQEGRLLQALPNPMGGLSIEVTVDFPHPAIGHQNLQLIVTEESFRKEIAPARSFILEKELKAAQNAGFIQGANLESGILFNEEGGVTNPEGLRFPNEPVRHKMLDALGDFALGGRMLQGKLALTLPGHTANNALLQKIIENQNVA